MSDTYLRRYTDIPALIYLLSKRKITLLDPRSWDDSNDSHYLTLYREKKGLKSVLALCFTQTGETYHHWRVFASGPSGVCIRFKRSELLRVIRKQPHLRTGAVNYMTLAEMRDKRRATEDLPFFKRQAFEPEDEFRMIYDSETTRIRNLDIPIPLSCIDRITLSPWIHRALYQSLKQRLRSIKGCHALKILRSTLISNEEWKDLGESAV